MTVIIAPYDMRSKTKEIDGDGIVWEAELYDPIRSALVATKLGHPPLGEQGEPSRSQDRPRVR